MLEDKCSAPNKLDHRKLEFSAVISLAGRSGNDEGIKVHGAQKAFILKQGADGHPVAEISRKAGISEATSFNWKKKYDGLLPDEMRRLKMLEDENAKLKKLVADLSLDKAMLQDVLRRKL
jgi:putative transposase